MVIALKFDETEVSFDALRYSRVDFSTKLMPYCMVLLMLIRPLTFSGPLYGDKDISLDMALLVLFFLAFSTPTCYCHCRFVLRLSVVFDQITSSRPLPSISHVSLCYYASLQWSAGLSSSYKYYYKQSKLSYSYKLILNFESSILNIHTS
jgi:hypothetical protein